MLVDVFSIWRLIPLMLVLIGSPGVADGGESVCVDS